MSTIMLQFAIFRRINVIDRVVIHSRFCHHLQLKQQSFVNNEWISAKSGQTFDVFNPANGKLLGAVPDMENADVTSAIESASKAFQTWQHTTAQERAILLRKFHGLLLKNNEKLAAILTSEQGKPVRESAAEIAYGAAYVEWFAEEARRIYGEVAQSPTAAKEMLFIRRPIGVACLITPWNFPSAMILRKLGAALAAGCTVVIKPAEDTPFSALALGELCLEANIPPGVVNIITCSRSKVANVSKLLCDSPLIAGVSFTGSTAVGKILYSQCSSTVKRLALELGGNAPFIVFESANLDAAVQGAMNAKFRNAGQACNAANRVLVQASVYDKFLEKIGEVMRKQLVVGDGFAPSVSLGPLINSQQKSKVEGLVKDAVSKGARVHLGGKPDPIGELFYEPTLLSNISSNMNMYHEEIFGPVVSVVKFNTEQEALQIANSSKHGLAGYFYSEDIRQIWRIAKTLEVGMVGINDGAITAVEIPFGGIKESGFGREGSRYGIDEYTYHKYICFGNLN